MNAPARLTPDFLHKVALLQDLDDETLSTFASLLHPKTIQKGGVVFRELDPSDSLYLVERGRVVVSKQVNGDVDIVLARFSSGDFFGEMGLFDAAPRSATAYAETDTVLWRLGRDAFERILSDQPAMAARICFRLVRVFIQRLRATNDQAREAIRWGMEATGYSPAQTSSMFGRKSS
jgi:CRP-like cAMP-binding protein